MKKRIFFALVSLILIVGFGASAQAGQAQDGGSVKAATLPQAAGQTQGTSRASLTAQAGARATALFMHIGSPVALADGKLLSLDKDNPGLAPVVYQTRTLVPLRVIGEYFGAAVSYDPARAEAVIDTGGHRAVFPVGKNYYSLDGAQRSLDVGTILVDGRAFVPLREICQETLGLTVDYRDDLIYVAPAAKLTDDLIRDVKSRIGMYVRATGLDALTKYMESSPYYSGYDINVWEGMDAVPIIEAERAIMMADTAPEGAMTGSGTTGAGTSAPAPAPNAPALSAPARDDSAEMSVAGGADAGGSFSATNIQVEGVDEGDIIKTDGKYIYIIAGSWLKIVDASNLKLAGEYDLGSGNGAQELYIDRDRAVIVGSRYAYQGAGPGPSIASAPGAEAERMIGIPVRGTSYTFVRVLDTANMAAIKSLRYYEVEGNLNASRKKGDFVYLVSGFAPWYRYDGIEIRPLAGENGRLAPIPVEKIMIMPGGSGSEFLTVSAVNIRLTADAVASETIAGSGYMTYMSSDNLYLAMYDRRYTDKETLNIARFSIDGARIGYLGSGSLAGGLNSQFSMDEYDGHLRVATTVSWPQSYNNLYVIDGNMEIKGEVTGFAPGERIYSARFMGTRGYIVTFRQVDPLFVFDLANPAAPKITGELKVPGFSSYLHPVSQDVILGVGQDVYDLYRMDAKGNQIVVGQRTGGIKVSLFDVSDMGKPREMDSLVLGDGGYTELLYNHKAAMFKTDAGLLGFCGAVNEEMGGQYFQGALLISYADGKLSEFGRLDYENPYEAYAKDDDLLYTGQRLAYIGDVLYYMQDGLLRSFNIRTLAPGASLRLSAR